MGGKPQMPDKLYAVFETSQGEIVCELFTKDTPVTVKNFVELAKGEKEWLDPNTFKQVKTPLYDGTVFHRVIPNFMIQGGDPLGSGIGGPGYKFEDEIVKGLEFDQPGKLAMANAGPNTNGSQFFITVVPTQWLNGKHTIFGKVITGQEIVVAISKLPTDQRNKPDEPVILKKVTIKETL